MSATELFDLAVWTKRWATRLMVMCGLVSLVAYAWDGLRAWWCRCLSTFWRGSCVARARQVQVA